MKQYIVDENDTLWRIGKRFGVTVVQLAEANGLKGKKIHQLRIKQKLWIPDNDVPLPDSRLLLDFRGMDFSRITPKKVKVAYDGREEIYTFEDDHSLDLCIQDHACGLKVWIEDLDKNMMPVLDREILPIGTWKVGIDSRKIKSDGTLQTQRGDAATSTSDLKTAIVQNAQLEKGKTTFEQTRVESGRPIHAIATIYTEANLRLSPGNERYRIYVIAAAKKYGLTPQSLAALIDAEAAKKDNTWQENSNEYNSDLAQGLAQFFVPAWTDVLNDPSSLLNIDCRKMKRAEQFKNRLVAKYAIDGAAAYALQNLTNFAKDTKYQIENLPPEDKAKVAYMLHHEGLKGAKRVIGIGKPLTRDEATERLVQQLGKKNIKKVDQLIAQYDGDAVAAYKGWLFSYTDSKINVNSFVVKDAEQFTNPPRTAAAIIAALSSQPQIIAPKPKPALSPQTKKENIAPARTNIKEASPTQGGKVAAPPAVGNTDSSWHDPLATCTLRTATLANKKGACFGWTRNGGKRAHQGIDLVAVPGTDIYAVANGVVYSAKSPYYKYDYGNTLVLVVNVNDLPQEQAAIFKKVNPGRNTIGFFYSHLSEIPSQKSFPVNVGDVIGKTGSTGSAEGMTTINNGAHLHFEVRQDALKKITGLNNRVDPLLFIKNCTNR
ncbi:MULTISPECIES: peptidoglycan DD-metalloendopeptidase family protein [unclassified Janthinobacterium]|uniref:peptidoglycan DD-metalloendopeptidase family protein n=1 Tax=unclassified Janthinobacterium TaxID=2610881 RepID=UPI00034A63D1|nr:MULTISPECIES: peptidoglycan DD-metalloendopeptidase family protein [unclassified Janthinobacterium]MEC5164228.1 murein DD-endopeptidase MepM/ murein hydrolase activator NlpD [Janthinobacterium sp. CG_S6]